MKNVLKFFVALTMLCASQAHAQWRAYYTGEYPFPTADNLGISPNVTFSNVTNPASPSPPQGLNWLANPIFNYGYVQVPVSALPAMQGYVAFYFQSAEAYQHTYDLFTVYNAQSILMAKIGYSTFTGLVNVNFGTETVLTNVTPLALNTNHTIIFNYSATGATLTVDTVAVSTTAALDLTGANTAYALGDPEQGTVSGATNLYMDGLAFDNAASAVFPPSIPTPSPTITVTPTFSDSPTITVSPTFTASPTKTDTSTFTASPTASPTDTPTFTASPTITQTFTASPTFTPSPTISPFVTAVPTPNYELLWKHVTIGGQGQGSSGINPLYIVLVLTPTFTASPTGTPTFTVSPTSTDTPTFTRSPTFTNSPTKTFTITQTFTVSPTFTASPTNSPSPTPNI